MNFDLIPTPDFEKSFKALSKKYRSLIKDFLNFSDDLLQNPFQGDEIAPGIRKIRMAIKSKGRGKSGGARIITYTILTHIDTGSIYFIDIYDKADFSTVDVPTIQKIIHNLNL